jgi:hypothetical protein
MRRKTRLKDLLDTDPAEREALLEKLSKELSEIPLWGQIEQEVKKFLRDLRKRKGEPPTPLQDLIAIYAPPPSLPRRCRLEAMQRLADTHLEKPIAWKRWVTIEGRVRKELRERAETNRSCTRDELNSCVLSALVLASEEMEDLPLSEEIMKTIRLVVNREVTEDLLGDDWRHRDGHTEFAEGERNPQFKQPGTLKLMMKNGEDFIVYRHFDPLSNIELETKTYLEIRAREEGLSSEETALLIAKAGEHSLAELAQSHHIPPSTLRSKIHRTRKKLKKS